MTDTKAMQLGGPGSVVGFVYFHAPPTAPHRTEPAHSDFDSPSSPFLTTIINARALVPCE